MGRILILLIALFVARPGIANHCSSLVDAYDLLPEKAAALLDQNDTSLESLGVNPEDSEVCGPACLVNFVELVAAARNLPAPDKRVLLEKVLKHFDDRNVDARKGLHFEQVLALLELESWKPADQRKILPEGTVFDGYGSAFHLRGREEGAAIAIDPETLLPKNGENTYAAMVQIQVYNKEETPGLHASRYSHFMLLLGKRNENFVFLDPQNPKKLRIAKIGKPEKTQTGGKSLTLHFQDKEFGTEKKILLIAFLRLKITP